MIKLVKDTWNKLKSIKNQNIDKEKFLTATKIENTPFRTVGNKDQGYCLTLGMYRITETKKTAEEAEKELSERPWIILLNVIDVCHQIDKMTEENEKFIKQETEN